MDSFSWLCHPAARFITTHTHTHKKSSERGFNQPAFLLLLIPTCSSAREQSNRSLCDSLEICSPRALTGRTRGCCQDVSFCKSNSRSRYPQQPLNTRWDGKYISQSWINSLLWLAAQLSTQTARATRLPLLLPRRPPAASSASIATGKQSYLPFHSSHCLASHFNRGTLCALLDVF